MTRETESGILNVEREPMLPHVKQPFSILESALPYERLIMGRQLFEMFGVEVLRTSSPGQRYVIETILRELPRAFFAMDVQNTSGVSSTALNRQQRTVPEQGNRHVLQAVERQSSIVGQGSALFSQSVLLSVVDRVVEGSAFSGDESLANEINLPSDLTNDEFSP